MALRHRIEEPWIDDEMEAADEFALWPLNLLLVVLGATVVALAFTYLDTADSRLLHNPWTYVVATPLVLLAIYLILSSLVSRVIEKSMQMAFLLSVLVHLLFVIGAMNVVIFSRLWPEVLESLAEERHQLKLQSLQAPQYHRLTSSTRAEERPDYLSFAETEHQATEVSKPKSTQATLIETTVGSLVSPLPKLDRRVKPHLLERRRAVASTSTDSRPLAKLSRSELQRDIDQQNAPEVISQAPGIWEPPTLRSSETRLSRNENARAATVPVLENRSQDLPSAADLSMPQTRSNASREGELLSSQLSILPLRGRESAEASRRSEAIPIPAPPLPSPTELESVQSSVAAIDSAFSRVRVRGQATALSPPPGPRDVASPALAASRPVRNRRETSIVETPAGESVRLPRRESAGGNPGAAAPSSLPIRGMEQVAAQQQIADRIVSPRLSVERRTSKGRETGSLPRVGNLSAAQWRESSAISKGTSGQTPLDLAFNDPSGQAKSSDSAALQGVGRVIQRSLAGPNAPQVSLPGESEGLSTAANATTAGQAAQQPSDEDASNLIAQVERSRSGGRSLLQSSVPPSLSDLSGPQDRGIATRLRIERADKPTGLPDRTDQLASAADRPRLRMEVGPPSSNQVEIGQMPEKVGSSNVSASEGSSSTDSQLSRNTEVSQNSGATRSRRSLQTRQSNLLAIEATIGPGGITPRIERVGSMLPERRERVVDSRIADFEVQRFPRQDVGGPLASGEVAIPQPAFQQRRDRLKSRAAMDSSMPEPKTELAIERGLAFLAKHQRQDGSWRLQDFDTEVLMTSDTAATGLALLAFQGAGYTHKEFKYADVCNRAIQFLRSHQLDNGDLYIPQNPASDQNAWLYSHAIAAIALCEAYGMTQDPDLQDTAQKSINFIVDSQDPLRGGWRYRPGAGSDTSVSGWFMMALKSAQLAGLSVPRQTFDRLRVFLTRSQSPDGRDYLYRYNPYAADTPQQRHGLKPTAVMTSVGLLMRLYTGWQRERVEMMRGADFLLGHLPEHGTQENSRRDTYYWYYATQVMFHMGGDSWRAWQGQLYPLLIEHQVTSGEYEGSWEPLTPTPDLWARYGGRLYVTTMNLLSLEVTYRHLPLYEATAPGKP